MYTSVMYVSGYESLRERYRAGSTDTPAAPAAPGGLYVMTDVDRG